MTTWRGVTHRVHRTRERQSVSIENIFQACFAIYECNDKGACPQNEPGDAEAALPEIGGHFDNRAAIGWENNLLCPFTKLMLSLIAQTKIAVD